MIRLHSPMGTLPFRLMAFPDGQRHVELLARDDGGFRTMTIEAALTSMDVLMDVLLLKEVLDHNGYITSLNVLYLMGARMDRRINARSPATLQVVARLLLGAGFRKISVLDPHSEATVTELGAQAVYPTGVLARVLREYSPADTVLIIPDKGATARFDLMLKPLPENDAYARVQCFKERDSKTGALSGFTVSNPSQVRGKQCLILDDICDGGGTFVGLAKVLVADHGAAAVDLFVTHGIFSKGLPLDGIGKVYTTDSFSGRMSEPGLIVFPFEIGL